MDEIRAFRKTIKLKKKLTLRELRELREARERLHAPAVWPFGFVNTLTVMQRRPLIREHQADALMGRATRIGVLVDSGPLDMAMLLNLARGMGLSAYDAAYIWSDSLAL